MKGGTLPRIAKGVDFIQNLDRAVQAIKRYLPDLPPMM